MTTDSEILMAAGLKHDNDLAAAAATYYRELAGAPETHSGPVWDRYDAERERVRLEYCATVEFVPADGL